MQSRHLCEVGIWAAEHRSCQAVHRSSHVAVIDTTVQLSQRSQYLPMQYHRFMHVHIGDVAAKHEPHVSE
jgi:hypothetical protein